jgi:hypothetical protein
MLKRGLIKLENISLYDNEKSKWGPTKMKKKLHPCTKKKKTKRGQKKTKNIMSLCKYEKSKEEPIKISI